MKFALQQARKHRGLHDRLAVSPLTAATKTGGFFAMEPAIEAAASPTPRPPIGLLWHGQLSHSFLRSYLDALCMYRLAPLLRELNVQPGI
jgi:hypothetical protein